MADVPLRTAPKSTSVGTVGSGARGVKRNVKGTSMVLPAASIRRFPDTGLRANAGVNTTLATQSCVGSTGPSHPETASWPLTTWGSLNVYVSGVVPVFVN